MAETFLRFAITFMALFGLMYVFLAGVDALPEPLKHETVLTQADTTVEDTYTPAVVTVGETPIRIVAKSIGMDNQILNPSSTNIATLDEALLNGVVRYPESGMLGVNGTVLLFGHSSYLPVVRNQNYKAFNGIQKLKKGEIVSVYAGSAEYRYTVTSVRQANAQEDTVALPADDQYLALVTCDTFGQKSDRFVVVAKLQGVY
jgi:LPXTG-site transpeptidase (sortase) family protein